MGAVVLAAVLPLASAPAASASVAAVRCSSRLSAELAAVSHRQRGITLAVAVRDLRSGRTFGYRSRARERTASIVKVEIVEALAHRSPHGIPSSLRSAARGMIERSDNADAQRLYEKVGRARGLRSFGRLAGLHDTSPAAASGPGYAWGLTLTSPLDQLRLLELIEHRNALLTTVNRRYILGLMRHVRSDQRWGVSSGVGSAGVALKDGWLPLHDWRSDWQINSIGIVSGATRRYLVAIESHGAASMHAGVVAVERVSRVVARACA